MSAPKEDHNRKHDFEQVSLATMIAHHTVYEKTRNLQRSPSLFWEHMRTWRVRIFVHGGYAISSRGHTSFFCAIAVKGHFALDKSCCKCFKWRHFIDADTKSHYILFMFVTFDIVGVQIAKIEDPAIIVRRRLFFIFASLTSFFSD